MIRLAFVLTLAALVLGFAGTLRASSPAPQEPRVTARLSSGVLKLGERTVLVIEAEGARKGRLLELPKVDGLQIGPPSGPSTRSFLSIANGRRSEAFSVSWTVPVRPLEEGEFEIPPLDLDLSGVRAQTKRLRLKVVADLRGEELGFVEVRPSARKVVEGQPFTVETRFGWDASLAKINFADLSIGWWDSLAGALELDREFPPKGAKAITGVSINGQSVVVEETAPVELEDRPFRTLRTLRTFVATRAGILEFSPSFLEFGRVEEGFFSNRKIQSYFVQAPTFYVEVVALPEEGQPFDYTGAVGTLAAEASVDARDVDVGDSIKFAVEWSGDGNLEFFGAPDPSRLEAFRGFRFYGRTEEKSFDKRRVVYDLAPLSPDIEAIPPLPLPVYDPQLEAYGTVATEPIAIRVRPLEGMVELEGPDSSPGVGHDIRDVDAAPLASAEAELEPPAAAAVVLVLITAPLLALFVRTGVRRRRGDPDAPLERRRRRARRTLRRELARAGDARSELACLYAFLAARTREPDGAWEGRRPSSWFTERGRRNGAARVSEEDLRALDRVIAELERSAYAGAGGTVERSRILAVADRLIGGGL